MDDNLKEKEQHDELIKLYSKWESICDTCIKVIIIIAFTFIMACLVECAENSILTHIKMSGCSLVGLCVAAIAYVIATIKRDQYKKKIDERKDERKE